MKTLLKLYGKCSCKDLTFSRYEYKYREMVNTEIYKLYLLLEESLRHARYNKYKIRVDLAPYNKIIAISATKIILVNMQKAFAEGGKFKKKLIEDFDSIDDALLYEISRFKAFSSLRDMYSSDTAFENEHIIIPNILIIASYFARINLKSMITHVLKSESFLYHYNYEKYACTIALVSDFLDYNSYEIFSPRNIQKFLYDEDVLVRGEKDTILKNISYNILLKNFNKDDFGIILKKFCKEYPNSSPEDIQEKIEEFLISKGVHNKNNTLEDIANIIKSSSNISEI